MKRVRRVTLRQLKTVLRYDPDTGHLHWALSRKGVNAGDIAGTLAKNPDGSPKKITIHLQGRPGRFYAAHHLAWLYVYGKWPPDQIDHINGNPHDNRLSNLRLCSQNQNMANTKKRADAITSKYKGVNYDNARDKWRARVGNLFFGRFDTEEEAWRVYDQKAIEIYGEFAKTNKQIYGVPQMDLSAYEWWVLCRIEDGWSFSKVKKSDYEGASAVVGTTLPKLEIAGLIEFGGKRAKITNAGRNILSAG